ncbi:MAG: hypothetical protein Q9216_000979 [Gyalolechia sp. 2 TL-2023]
MSGRSSKPEVSAAERIAQLNDIDKDVATLLQSAGTAINTLTIPALESNETPGNKTQGIEQRKEDFTHSSRQYFAILSSIDVRLRRHISALEEAEIIPSETANKDAQASTNMGNPLARSSAPTKSTITNSGLGSLDVGWLNSRNDKVEKMMEAELWKEAQELVQKKSVTEKDPQSDNDITASSETTRSQG